ncbi:hypothetical protein [Massilia sp. TSP1-1-2]|uniref:hypothetical protein n=1 Tax=Massilia sp. TSP1-1-2 TaxID=2804649 RepID=UPI003CF0023B
MDHSEHPHAHKHEPTLAPQANVQPAIDAGEMPAWLSNQSAAPTAGQRWGRRVIFLGIALVTIAVAAGATMLALDLYESNSSMEVVAANASAPAPAPPLLEKRVSSLPPLVMLPQEAVPAHKKEETAAVAHPQAVAETPKPAAPSAPAPVTAKKVEKPAAPSVHAPAPVVAKKVEKPAAPAVVAAKPAKKVVPKPTIAAVAKKAAIIAKRVATPAVAKVQPRARPIKGTMLQPPRERGLDPAFQEPPRQAVDRRCRPGELARECEERTR